LILVLDLIGHYFEFCLVAAIILLAIAANFKREIKASDWNIDMILGFKFWPIFPLFRCLLLHFLDLIHH
jgi:hypothetical protein